MMPDEEYVRWLEAFEAATKAGGGRGELRRESRDYWAKGYVYESLEGNMRFLAFRAGYELGRKGEVGKCQG